MLASLATDVPPNNTKIEGDSFFDGRLFDPAQLDRATLLNATTGQKAMYGLPVGQLPHLIHVWKSLLEEAGFTLEDIPPGGSVLVVLVR